MSNFQADFWSSIPMHHVKNEYFNANYLELTEQMIGKCTSEE
jgi:hypothetical protein